MVNGYLPRLMRQEFFAGLCRRDGAFCPPGAPPIGSKLLIILNFIRWHGFCNSPLAAAWESGRHARRGCHGIVLAPKGRVSDGECPSRRPVAADVAQSRARRRA